MAFLGVTVGTNSLSSAFVSSGVKAFLLLLVPLLTPFFSFLRVANMSIFRNYTTDDFGRLCFLPTIPSFVDPDEEESFSVSHNSPKDYFFGQMGARPKPSSVKSHPSFGRVRKVKEVRFVDGLNTTLRGIPSAYDRSTSWRLRDWTAREAYSFWQERYRWYPLGEYHSSACWGYSECCK